MHPSSSENLSMRILKPLLQKLLQPAVEARAVDARLKVEPHVRVEVAAGELLRVRGRSRAPAR